MIKLFIVDDHPSIVMGVKAMLQYSEGISVAGTFHNGRDLLKALKVQSPDVLLLDIHLPDISGNRLARIISKKYPQIAILAFTNMNTDFHFSDMISHGCLGYLLKTADMATLVRCIQEVNEGRIYIDQLFRGTDTQYKVMQTNKLLGKLPTLTQREQDIIQYICDGLTSKEIASRLSLSLRTVENHRFNLLQKLELKSSTELVKLALHAGWADA